jgi:hypothetical protein
MSSLYDELSEKVARNAAVSKRGVSTFDLTLLMFNARDDVRDLWVAAEAELAAARAEEREPREDLATAVEKLRPIFGERGGTPA